MDILSDGEHKNAGPNQSATPATATTPGGARSKENSGAISECYSHPPRRDGPSRQEKITVVAQYPDSTKASLEQRLRARARERWPQIASLQIRHRGTFSYVDATLTDATKLKLCRLRYVGSASQWQFPSWLTLVRNPVVYDLGGSAPTLTALARYDMGVRTCGECGQRLPRAYSDAGRPRVYCSDACRQRAYRRRGGVASGTTGAERRRRERERPRPPA
jgi:hypothetical protein